MSYFNEMRLKYKLMAAFFLALAPLMAIGGYVSYAYIERTYRQATLNELKNSADALVQMVETTATVAIRNYLRAVAEKSLEIVQDLYRNHQAGKMDKAPISITLQTSAGM